MSFTAVMGALGAAGSFANAIGGLFKPSVKKQIKWQKEAQKELNEQAADLNYRYGEMSAQNAYNRQMEMYERSYQDNSYSAMRKQMEDAGLSAGLMYGNGGSGGGAGSMTGAPQGETGGATAGDAGMALSAAMQMEGIKTQRIAVAADAALKYAQVEKLEADTNRQQQIIDTEEFNKVLNQLRMKNAQDYADLEIDSRYFELYDKKLNHYYDMFKKTGQGKGWDKDLGNYDFEEGWEGKKLMNETAKIIEEMGEIKGRVDLMEFQKVLYEKQAYNYYMTAVAAMERNDIERAKTAIEKIVAEYGTGQRWNWKTVLDAVIGITGATSEGVKAAASYKGAKALKGARR